MNGMPLLVMVLLAFVIAMVGAITTYFYLDREGLDDKKVKFAIMVFFIILLVILIPIYGRAISIWVGNFVKPSAS